LIGFPDLRDNPNPDPDSFRSFLKFKRDNTEQVLFNSGFFDHRSSINSLARGEKFVFRIKASKAIELNDSNRPKYMKSWTPIEDGAIGFKIASYNLENGKYNIEELYFSGSLTFKENSGWLYSSSNKFITSLVSKSYSELLNKKVGIFLETPVNKEVYFENIQCFKYITYDKLVSEEGQPEAY
jgi:hypothetical protein